MEEQQQQQKKEMPEFFDGNKIQANREYYINSNEYNGKTFYKIIFYQKGYDGQPQKFFKAAKFKGDPVIPNGTKILLKQFIENGYYLKDDPKHFKPQFAINILSWEIVEQGDKIINEAYSDYDSSQSGMPDLPF